MKKIGLILKAVWKDPVWSKVIAAAILLGLGYFSGLVFYLIALVSDLDAYIQSQPFAGYAILLLALLVLAFIWIWRLLPRPTRNATAVEWISSLTMAELSRFSFLFWFPLNRRLKTHNIENRRSFAWGQISFDHIPEFRELVDRGVLKYSFEGVMEHSVEIDRDTYNYLAGVYHMQEPTLEPRVRATFEAYRGSQFHDLFPDSRQY